MGALQAKFPKQDQPDPILGWQGYSVRKAALEFETVLAAELQVMDTYFVVQKGSHKTCDLVERAHIAFPAEIRSTLPEQAKADFDQAGKCMAFDVPTAAAFHLLRGTEVLIRKYYEQVVGTKPKLKMRNWGAYISQLEKCKAEPKIISLLKHLKDAYRNPVLHAEENYTDDQAQVLFGVCISAVVLMESECRRLTAKGAPLVFPAAAPGQMP